MDGNRLRLVTFFRESEYRQHGVFVLNRGKGAGSGFLRQHSYMIYPPIVFVRRTGIG
jgi:hypothetical protein